MSEKDPAPPDDSDLARVDEIWGWRVGVSQRRVEMNAERQLDPAFRELIEDLDGRKPFSVERAEALGVRHGSIQTLRDGVWVPDPDYSSPSEPLEPPSQIRKERRRP